MSVPNFYFNLIVYLYPSVNLAKKNEKIGGTGFLVGVESEEKGKFFVYIVTNCHILEKIKSTGSKECAIRINTKDGKTDILSTSLERWFHHPEGDDIAICPLKTSENWKINFITEDFFLKPEYIRGDIFNEEPEPEKFEINIHDDGTTRKWEEIGKIGIGDETVTVGRFIKHSGDIMNYPVVRKGHIAMLPFEPIKQKNRDFMQDSFLVESYSIGGFSGSPVFVQTSLETKNRSATGSGTAYHNKVFLLGIDWGHFDFEGDLIDPISGKISTPSGMMCVVPSWKLSELLLMDGLNVLRKELEKLSKDSKKEKEMTEGEFEELIKKVQVEDKNGKGK